jgi:hypothetical protein
LGEGLECLPALLGRELCERLFVRSLDLLGRGRREHVSVARERLLVGRRRGFRFLVSAKDAHVRFLSPAQGQAGSSILGLYARTGRPVDAELRVMDLDLG